MFVQHFVFAVYVLCYLLNVCTVCSIYMLYVIVPTNLYFMFKTVFL